VYGDGCDEECEGVECEDIEVGLGLVDCECEFIE